MDWVIMGTQRQINSILQRPVWEVWKGYIHLLALLGLSIINKFQLKKFFFSQFQLNSQWLASILQLINTEKSQKHQNTNYVKKHLFEAKNEI